MNAEELYQMGKMPLNHYNQLNGKTAQENYNRIKKLRQQEFKQYIYGDMKKELSGLIESALDEILSGFNSL